MNDGLSESEKKALLRGVNPSDPPMPTEEFKAMLIRVFMNQGKSYEEAKKIVDDRCEKDGIK
ncbi:MAG: hypothetical protein LBI04_01935 [Treponema sp.]|jgi:hypothetical protein|nr:hypothetical protein [Treponema sp.]